MGLETIPIDYPTACAFINKHHRHHLPPQGWKFGIGCADENGQVVGVVTVGRPVSRHRDDGLTLEVTRCCTDGSRNACSMLYGAAWRASRAMGYRELITYTLASEGGASLRASGYQCIGEAGGKPEWWASRNREVKGPGGQKLLWSTTTRRKICSLT
jgi:hypothetical protein